MQSQAVQSPTQILPFAAPLNILLVEDEDSDAVLTQLSLDLTGVECIMQRLESGMDVMPYLCRRGAHKNAVRPDMMLLDLSLPTKDGFEVLSEIATQAERFRTLPIVILTGDTHCAFLRHSYDLNIVAYITKPCSAEKLRSALRKAQS